MRRTLNSHTDCRLRWLAEVVAVLVILALLLLVLLFRTPTASAQVWSQAWPRTDFSLSSVDLGEIVSGGAPRDGIPAIDEPRFCPVSEGEVDLAPMEPVISVVIDGVAKAYPLRILIWHEIVNDVVGTVPVTVTYCPLCNSSIVFSRRVGTKVLDFGTTGMLRHSDLVMYDRQTESWWQQYTGEAIVGSLTGTRLKVIPSRVEPWRSFQTRHPDGEVLVPNDPGLRRYGVNPYIGYESVSFPPLYRGVYDDAVAPMAYVVAIGDTALPLERLQEVGEMRSGDLVVTWTPGMNSALDSGTIAAGRDIGMVMVQRDIGDTLVDVAHEVTFAFVFKAFNPDGEWMLE